MTSKQMAETVYIGLGSNLGDRRRFLEEAIERIEQIDGLEVVGLSGVYLTQPQNMEPGSPPFYNQVARVEYAHSPVELLQKLEEVEQGLGRTDKGKNQSRSIDLDILLFGRLVVETADLSIPHPRLSERPFMLVPILDIDPSLTHPADGSLLSESMTEKQKNEILLVEDNVAREV